VSSIRAKEFLVVVALTVGLVGCFDEAASASPVSCTGNGPFTAGTVGVTCVVGPDLTGIHVVAVGAPGGTFSTGQLGGKGATVTADMALPAGTAIIVSVGGKGADSGTTGGANGGGAGGTDGAFHGAAGGGASDLRMPTDATTDRVLVAGGGGGGGFDNGSPGAMAGANADGGSGGFIVGGTSATGSTVGHGGGESPCQGNDGTSVGVGGAGFGDGGGGGGGLSGGGGGGEVDSGGTCTDSNGGGGGGGSSLVPSGGSKATDTTGIPMITITAPVPATSSGPTISGSPVVGQTLTESPAPWSNSPTTIALQWLRCDTSGSGCVPIGTGTATYVLTADDVGHTVKAQETASNFYGSSLAVGAAGTATSTPTPVVASNVNAPTLVATSPACQQIAVSVKNNDSSGPGVQYTVTATSGSASLTAKTNGTVAPGQTGNAAFSDLARGGTYAVSATGDDGSVTAQPATVSVATCAKVDFKAKIGKGHFARHYAKVKLNNRRSSVAVPVTVVSVHHSSHQYTVKANEVRTVEAYIASRGHSEIKVVDNVGVEPKRTFFHSGTSSK
jgi:hypothetical protein